MQKKGLERGNINVSRGNDAKVLAREINLKAKMLLIKYIFHLTTRRASVSMKL